MVNDTAGGDAVRNRPTGGYPDLTSVLRGARSSTAWQRLPAAHVQTLDATAGLVADAAPGGYTELHRLISAHGHQRIALFQGAFQRFVGPQLHAQVETAFIWRIGDEERTRGRLLVAGTDADAAADVASSCYSHMFWLLLRDIDRVDPVTDLPSPRRFRDLIQQGTVEQWRAALAPVAAHPWGSHGEDLAALADEAGLPVVAGSLRACRQAYQLLREDDERRAVADEIRHRVKVSGQTQAAFAAYVGTSPSRLSTYISGKVTPSAAMLLRIQRASELLAERGRD